MNKFKVIDAQAGYFTVRWIDSPWYEEHNLGPKSFVDDCVTLSVGDYYSCLRRTADNYKLSCILPMGENEDEVIEYNSVVDKLKSSMKVNDPICKIHLNANHLKFIKAKTNPFFKDVRSVSAWLIKKEIENANKV